MFLFSKIDSCFVLICRISKIKLSFKYFINEGRCRIRTYGTGCTVETTHLRRWRFFHSSQKNKVRMIIGNFNICKTTSNVCYVSVRVNKIKTGCFACESNKKLFAYYFGLFRFSLLFFCFIQQCFVFFVFDVFFWIDDELPWWSCRFNYVLPCRYTFCNCCPPGLKPLIHPIVCVKMFSWMSLV